MGNASRSVDSQNPVINGSVTGTSGDNSWFISSADLSASASDPTPGSGMASFEYALDGGMEAAFPGTLTLGDGSHTVVFTARDVAGHNSTQTQNVNVDTGLPVITVDPFAGTAGANGWFVSDVTFSASAADPAPGSGVATFTYTLDSGAPTAWAGPLTLGEGTHALSLSASDVAGNASSDSATVNVDYSAPLVSLTGNAAFCPACGDTLTLTYSANDAISRLDTWALDADGTALTSGSGSASGTYDWDGSGLAAGTHTLRLQGADLAGNAAQTTLAITITEPAPIPPPAQPPAPGVVVVVPPAQRPRAANTLIPTATSGSAQLAGPAAQAAPLVLSGQLPTATTVRPVSSISFENQPSAPVTPPASAAALPLSNILWGAQAAAAMAAVTAYILSERKKRDIEAQQRADEQARIEAVNRAQRAAAALASSQANAQATQAAYQAAQKAVTLATNAVQSLGGALLHTQQAVTGPSYGLSGVKASGHVEKAAEANKPWYEKAWNGLVGAMTGSPENYGTIFAPSWLPSMDIVDLGAVFAPDLSKTIFGEDNYNKIQEFLSGARDSIESIATSSVANVIGNTFNYAAGAGSQFLDDMSLGLAGKVLGINWDNGGPAFQQGRILGRSGSDTLSIVEAVLGVANIIGGLTMVAPTAGGTTLCTVGTGPFAPACIAVGGSTLVIEVAAVVAGAAMTAHGGAVKIRNGVTSYQSSGVNSSGGEAGEPVFENEKLLNNHYEDHKAEFGNISKETYLEKAQILINSSEGNLTKFRDNGDILYYNPTTNEFAVLSKDGIIRTYFKPREGMDYWTIQKGVAK